MIIEALISVVVGAVEFVVELLPLADELDVEGLSTFVGFIRGMDAALPIAETIAMGTMCLAITLAVYTWHFWVMIYKLLPFT